MGTYLVADLFCGAGGSSTGAERAISEIDGSMELVAVNHWPVAVATHQKNHPTARHYVENLETADPETLVPERYLDLLMASPECRFYSRARGGKPVHDQSRMNPWIVQRWLTALNVRCLLVENVPEFIQWGPLNDDGRPDKSKRGIYFEAWIKALWELGYQAEWRMLNAADHGDATTRIRFFLLARNDGKPLVWPSATHSKKGEIGFLGTARWRAAREIIDWDNQGRSLLDDPKYQRKPLSEKTRRRIARGLERFGGPLASLYIRLLGLEPGAAPAAQGPESFVMGKQSNPTYRDVSQPVPSITTEGSVALVQPVLAQYNGQSEGADVAMPLPTVTGTARFGLARPILLHVAHGEGWGDRVSTPDEPLPALTANGTLAMAQGFIVPYRGEKPGQEPRAHSVDEPVPAITAEPAFALARPVIIQTDQTGGNGSYTRPADAPVLTVVSKQNTALVNPVVVAGSSVDPSRIVLIDGAPYVLDIRFRMLTNAELARAMGFEDEEAKYEFVGTVHEVTRQIGNAVPVHLATALVKAALGGAG